ncbi:hypothetical protein I4F81_008331 [Pyropia yezoensis]|uniref:Uncharacterized protein n=1 Tax=Pyropia yezoensis TaxID=2788 RepID=A0ACC3C6V9_PYRYE|nr:hypothetical protein I4F81_008331 [Neopyropia yezoensis]
MPKVLAKGGKAAATARAPFNGRPPTDGWRRGRRPRAPPARRKPGLTEKASAERSHPDRTAATVAAPAATAATAAVADAADDAASVAAVATPPRTLSPPLLSPPPPLPPPSPPPPPPRVRRPGWGRRQRAPRDGGSGGGAAVGTADVGGRMAATGAWSQGGPGGESPNARSGAAAGAAAPPPSPPTPLPLPPAAGGWAAAAARTISTATAAAAAAAAADNDDDAPPARKRVAVPLPLSLPPPAGGAAKPLRGSPPCATSAIPFFHYASPSSPSLPALRRPLSPRRSPTGVCDTGVCDAGGGCRLHRHATDCSDVLGGIARANTDADADDGRGDGPPTGVVLTVGDGAIVPRWVLIQRSATPFPAPQPVPVSDEDYALPSDHGPRRPRSPSPALASPLTELDGPHSLPFLRSAQQPPSPSPFPALPLPISYGRQSTFHAAAAAQRARFPAADAAADSAATAAAVAAAAAAAADAAALAAREAAIDAMLFALPGTPGVELVDEPADMPSPAAPSSPPPQTGMSLGGEWDKAPARLGGESRGGDDQQVSRRDGRTRPSPLRAPPPPPGGGPLDGHARLLAHLRSRRWHPWGGGRGRGAAHPVPSA